MRGAWGLGTQSAPRTLLTGVAAKPQAAKWAQKKSRRQLPGVAHHPVANRRDNFIIGAPPCRPARAKKPFLPARPIRRRVEWCGGTEATPLLHGRKHHTRRRISGRARAARPSRRTSHSRSSRSRGPVPRVRGARGNRGKVRNGHRKANRQNLPRLRPIVSVGRSGCRSISVAEAEHENNRHPALRARAGVGAAPGCGFPTTPRRGPRGAGVRHARLRSPAGPARSGR